MPTTSRLKRLVPLGLAVLGVIALIVWAVGLVQHGYYVDENLLDGENRLIDWVLFILGVALIISSFVVWLRLPDGDDDR